MQLRRGPGRLPPAPELFAPAYAGRVHLSLAAIVVHEYDPAIAFFVDVLGFELVEDSPATTSSGRPSAGSWSGRRARDRLPAGPGERDDESAVVGRQLAGRVGFFLRVDDFDASYARMTAAGVEFVSPPPSRTARSWCSWTLRATAGTCWARHNVVAACESAQHRPGPAVSRP